MSSWLTIFTWHKREASGLHSFEDEGCSFSSRVVLDDAGLVLIDMHGQKKQEGSSFLLLSAEFVFLPQDDTSLEP